MTTRSLQRKIGLWGASFSGLGVIVGAGIYALLGEATALAGGTVWISFLMAAGVAGLTAISYIRLSRIVTKDSPEFQYVKLGLGFRAGFTAGWLTIWAQIISAATVALGFGGYFQLLSGAPIITAALGLVIILSLIVWFGIKESVFLVTLLSLVEIGGLVLVIILGIHHLGDNSLMEASTSGFSGVWSAAALIFFAYVGFEQLGNLAEEMHSPEKDLPRAIAIAFLVSTVLYVLVSVSAVSLVGWRVLAASQAPLADVVAGDLKHWSKLTLTLIALSATANTVLLMLISVSRSFYGMAQAQALPRVFGLVGVRHTPWFSSLLVLIMVGFFVLIGKIALVAKIANLTILLAFALVNLSLARMLKGKLKEKKTEFSFSDFWGIVHPILALLSCLFLAFKTGWLPITVGLFMIATGYSIAKWRDVKTSRRQKDLQ